MTPQLRRWLAAAALVVMACGGLLIAVSEPQDPQPPPTTEVTGTQPVTTAEEPTTTTPPSSAPTTADRLAGYLADQYPRTDPADARAAIEQTCQALAAGTDPLTGPAATAGLLPMAYPDLARFGVAWLCPQHAAALDAAIPRPPA